MNNSITRVHDELTLHEDASVHAEYVFWHGMPAVYEYNRADDGLECEVITRILARHPLYIPGEEKRRLRMMRSLDAVSLITYHKLFRELTVPVQSEVRATLLRSLDRMGLL